jgi:hypothetical protein
MAIKGKKPIEEPMELNSPCSSGDCAIAESTESAESVESTEPKTEESAIAESTEPQGLYPTALLSELGFNYCDKCGAQFQSDIYGNPICPENLKGCPRV